MNLKVIIVDDDPTIKILHKAMVVRSNLNAQPFVFGDGQAALDFLNTQVIETTDLFLVLLDINMPVMNGWVFLDEIQSKTYTSQLLVIMVTSSVDSSDKEKADMYPQVINYLEKPLKMDTCNFIKTLPLIAPFYL